MTTDLLREARETLAWHALYNATLAPGSSALIARIDAALAQPAASEPVATLYQHSEDGRTMVVMRGNVLAAPGQYQPVGELFLHPPAAPRTLTDEEIDAIADGMPGGMDGFLKGWGWRQFARAIERALSATPEQP